MPNLKATITWNKLKQQLEYIKSEIDLIDLIETIGIYPPTLCSINLNHDFNVFKKNEKIINLCLEKGNMDNTARYHFLMGLLSSKMIGISYIREKLSKKLFEGIVKELKENKNISFFVKLCLAILEEKTSASDIELMAETPILLHAILLALGLSNIELPTNYSQEAINNSNIEFTTSFGNSQSTLSFCFDEEKDIDFQEKVLSKIKELLREKTSEYYLNWPKYSDSYHSLSTEHQLKTKTRLNQALTNNQIIQIRPAYLIVMDCSLDKKGNMIIYECQSAKDSGLGEFSQRGEQIAELNSAFRKAFSSINIEYNDNRHLINVDNPRSKIIFYHATHPLKKTWQDHIIQIYKSDWYDYKKIESKICPRLFLPTEVNPRYYILETKNKTLEKLVDEVKIFCEENNIKDIVIKKTYSFNGKGNYFIDNITEEKIKNKINDILFPEEVKMLNYLLIEEQKIFPTISNKTGKQKDYFRTYRMISIVTEEKCLGRFILSKNLSKEIDSHNRDLLKCYINPLEGASRIVNTKYVGLKDKYYMLGDNPININPEILQKVDKSLFTLLSSTEDKITEQLNRKIAQQDLQWQKSKAASPAHFFNNKESQINTELPIIAESCNKQESRQNRAL